MNFDQTVLYRRCIYKKKDALVASLSLVVGNISYHVNQKIALCVKKHHNKRIKLVHIMISGYSVFLRY